MPTQCSQKNIDPSNGKIPKNLGYDKTSLHKSAQKNFLETFFRRPSEHRWGASNSLILQEEGEEEEESDH